MRSKLLILVFFALCVGIAFPFLFSLVPISGGDYTPTTTVIQQLSANFLGWCGYRNLGFNCIAINLHYSIFWILIRFFSSMFHLPDALSERVFLWIPFFILSFGSISLLVKKVFPSVKFWFLAPLLYLFNTYVLMLLGGGQISGIAMGYALVPLVLLFWIYLTEKQNVFWSIVWGLAIAVLIAIDPRIGFIGGLLCVFYSFVYTLFYKKYASISFRSILRMSILLFILPLLIAVGLHFYWILPTLVYHQNPLHELGPAYDTTGAVKFFSFATFENALSLLHPNWPENIFGLTHFMRPEFLLLPLLIFCSLLFIKKGKQNSFYIIFLLLLALVGVFLAKGANEPFGALYLLMFEKVPGFSLFRDSTKWYLFVAVSYSVLLPFVVESIFDWIRLKKQLQNVGFVFVSINVLFILFLVRPVFLHQLSGTFQSHSVPKAYEDYLAFLQKDPAFFRTMWVPVSSRYGQFDVYHPTIDAGNFLNASQSSILADFQKPQFQKTIEEASVKYIVVPADTNHEIFITDRKYDKELYANAVLSLQKVSWLKRMNNFGNIVIFQVKNPKPHFWLSDEKGSVSVQSIDSNTYVVKLQNVTQGEKLIFSESYNNGWVARVGLQNIPTSEYDTYFNSFALPKSGSYLLTIRFAPQDLVEEGLWISGVISVVIVFYFLKKIIH